MNCGSTGRAVGLSAAAHTCASAAIPPANTARAAQKCAPRKYTMPATQMPPTDREKQQIVQLLRTGDPANRALALQLAQAIGWNCAEEWQLDFWAANISGSGEPYGEFSLEWDYMEQATKPLLALRQAAPYLHYLQTLCLHRHLYPSEQRQGYAAISMPILDEVFGCLQAGDLHTLCLRNFPLTPAIGRAIFRLPSLRKLSLINTSIGADFWQFSEDAPPSALEEIYISAPEQAQKNRLPTDLKGLPKLRKIICADLLRWEQLPAWLGQVEQNRLSARLDEIYRFLSGSFFPAGFEQLQQLRGLHLLDLPGLLRHKGEVGQAIVLQGLSTIGALRGLRALTLQNLLWQELPDWLRQMQQLRWLNLSQNQLRQLPPFPRLHTLLLNSNKGLALREEDFEDEQRIACLRRLELSHCSLDKLPASIGRLQNLRILRLRGNNLMYLPASMQTLSQLEVLDLAGNRYLSVHDIVPLLRCLKNLRLLIVDRPPSSRRKGLLVLDARQKSPTTWEFLRDSFIEDYSLE